MKILQVSAPKSGSFWLNTILKKTLEKAGEDISYFIKTRPEYQFLKQEKLSFKDQAGIDMLDIEGDGVFFRVSSLLKEPVPDLENYSKKATLAWTHSTWCQKTPEVFTFFDRKVCIVRDPRDTALSAAKFAFTPYMQEHYTSPYKSVEEFFSAEYENLLEQWVWFYGNYLLHSKDLKLHFVFYENLLKSFPKEYDSLLKYLELELPAQEKQKIEKEVSFSSMKEESPRHLRKGESRKWVDQLSIEEIEKASVKAGALMRIFGYPLTPGEGDKLPAIPREIPKKELQSILEKIDWKKLY
ncbi:sulfotransferase domain-containing protein [Salinimicrobium sediminilitoris]|uniref:sulfotransferase domain-containing protein n=1 Tax=Salinimicrobium sediminilitoris TaxID=2876715 RepID=UPI001E484AA1|nr:sulfotransferase domain-containing protein [Salinimicrobium sediminilitoris]MCC8361161.1 sulfotransferase domain-containing protein [Salinimicrobium sediminilitoris]